MTSDVYLKPLPEISTENRPFWDGLREREFRAPRCTECGDFGWIPYPACRTCLSTEIEWVALSGAATVFSYSIVHRGPGAFADDVPYVLILAELAELAEQPRPMLVLAQLTGSPLADVRIGLPIEVAFHDIADEDVTLYSFVARS